MRQLNGAEALMGFLGWLMSRDLPITFSARHNATDALTLYDQWTAVNHVGALGADWPDCIQPVEAGAVTNEEKVGFKDQLTHLINFHSLEGGSATPDFLLADYLVQCLAVFDVTIAHREAWYGRPLAAAGDPTIGDIATQRMPTESPGAPPGRRTGTRKR